LLRRRLARGVLNLTVGGVTLLPATIVDAQTDEIQVYDAEINNPGGFSLQLHNNYTPIGRKRPDFMGGFAPNHTLNGVPEWAWGITDWLELGAYAPVYSWTGDGRLLIDGAKLRAEFVVPYAAERSFFYGVNFELGFNARYWEPTRTSGEIRPIIGWRFGDGFSFTFNPIVDNSYKGLSKLEFVPATRLDYKIDNTWTVAVEEYDDFGDLHRFLPGSQQFHQLWAVADYTGDPVSIEAGIGAGLTQATDDLAVKLMFMSDLTGPHGILSR
jgi:hypothetical protein